MFQCLGLGSVETGGCGEDWWHPECLIGLPRTWNAKSTEQKVASEDRNEAAVQANSNVGANEHRDEEADGDGEDDEEETPLPPGFPEEDDFETFICYKCMDSNPWLKHYAGTPGFLPPVFRNGGMVQKTEIAKGNETETSNDETNSKKRKAEDDQTQDTEDGPTSKRPKEAEDTKPPSSADSKTDASAASNNNNTDQPKPKHEFLPHSTSSDSFSLFLKEDFRDHLCRCATCFPNLAPHIQLREEEDTYEPPLSDDGSGDGHNGNGSTGTGSLLDRGEAALSNIDRVRAIEGAMVYNHLRDKVKEFLKPFAETGKAVSAEDIKGYFERLRGDDQGISEAGNQALQGGSGRGGDE